MDANGAVSEANHTDDKSTAEKHTTGMIVQESGCSPIKFLG